jgi:dolichol-phosphate mannosyltransferase
MLELASVVPTCNERENVEPLVNSLEEILRGIEYEVVFVDDDSPDGTAEFIRSVALRRQGVRVLQRLNRRGLASACMEGMLATAAPYIAVMDADLQHDESILPSMLRKLKAERLDIVVASRNMAGGSMGDFSRERVAISGLGRKVSRMIAHCEMTDPMSGFFVLDRRFLGEVQYLVSAIGFKILLDLVASSSRPVRIGEVPYRFRTRQRGESKLDVLVMLEYLQLVLDKMVGDLIPARFALFAFVGATGAVISLTVLALLHRAYGMAFEPAFIISAVAAMTSNFFLNNSFTYRDRRLRGAGLIIGLLTFYAACSIGVFTTVVLADVLQQGGLRWYVAGAIAVAISSVWNYGMTRAFTWRMGRQATRRRAAAVAAISPNSRA